MKKQKTIVIKIGGSTLGSNDTALLDIAAIQKGGITPIIVHGGGANISKWMNDLGTMPRFVKGMRVTDGPTLEVVIAVLAGLVNKNLVLALSRLGAKAVGISGVDGELFRGKMISPELGMVGEIVEINPDAVQMIQEKGYIPVIAPLAIDVNNDEALLNLNADVAAGRLAEALMADQLLMLTDVPGVMDNSQRRIPRLTSRQAKSILLNGVASGGMIPKIEACLMALENTSVTRIIDGREANVLLRSLDGEDLGTRIG